MEPLRFHTDLYDHDALESAADKFRDRALVALSDCGDHIVARLEPLGSVSAVEVQAFCDEFCTEALSATVSKLRHPSANDSRGQERMLAAPSAPPWRLLAPFAEGAEIGFGWGIDSLSPIRAGAAVLVLRHESGSSARVAIHRNGGAPRGVAYTRHLDFMLMNDGGGTAPTDDSIAGVLIDLAETLSNNENGSCNDDLVAALSPHSETQTRPGGAGARSESPRRVVPRIDVEARTVSFELEEVGTNRLEISRTALAFADRCYVFLARPDSARVAVRLTARETVPSDVLKALARDATKALNRVVRGTTGGSGSSAMDDGTRLPALRRPRVDVDALLAELDAANAATLGLGFEPERGPGHTNLRVLNIVGSGACNSACAFCVEKFDPTHRPRAKVDALRELILESAGKYDMLFFASGEPSIHPQLFEHVELAKSVGFTCFGMSSHFRSFGDPGFALKVLEAGFEYFDIALHAADTASQLEINPIGDSGQSLDEALKGLAVLLRLADALGLRVSITHKIVVSRLNVLQLESIFRATYDRGVRHFILQPVRSLGLPPESCSKLAIEEDEILPHLNELLRRTEGLGVVIKPYGFSRQNLYSGPHVEHEQNRVKNMWGAVERSGSSRHVLGQQEERPTDGRYWVEVELLPEGRFSFASDGGAPVLDDALGSGLQLPFGCRMGSCGICCARLLEGRVDQSSQIFLTEAQMQQGFVLTCQAHPLSDVVLKMCTDDEVDQL